MRGQIPWKTLRPRRLFQGIWPRWTFWTPVRLSAVLCGLCVQRRTGGGRQV